MHDIEHLPGIYTLGYIGENDFRTIEIDMSAWLEIIPNGVASILHIRPGESSDKAYLAATTFSNGIIRWPITLLDIGNNAGYGSMQVSLSGVDGDGHQVGKSEIVRTKVNASAMDVSGDIPSAQQNWMEQMQDLLADERTAMNDIQNIVEGVINFPIVTYVECSSWENLNRNWYKVGSNRSGRSYGLLIDKPASYEPRENDLLMIKMKADLQTPYSLTKYYISFGTEHIDPNTGMIVVGEGETYPINNMQYEYDTNINLFEKDRIYAFRYVINYDTLGTAIKGYDVLNYTPGVKELADRAEAALTEARSILNGSAVRVDVAQELTNSQKAQARNNIDAAQLVDGKVSSSQLPSYVDDVLEFSTRNAFPAEGESGKIYVAMDTNLTYRWSGSTYVEISQSLALGETASTAFPGNRGLALETEVGERPKIVYAECTDITTNPTGLRRINVSVPNNYSPNTGDYLVVRFPANEVANPPQRYALHYNFNGSIITNDLTVMNIPQDKFTTGTVIWEADSIYLFRHIDADECEIVSHRVGQALGDTSGTAFPGERGKAIEDALIKVQNTQPTEPVNKLWFKETPESEIQIPTYTELQEGLSGKQDNLTFDDVPTSASNNPVKSGGVYNAINTVADSLDEQTALRLLQSDNIENTVSAITFDQQTGNITQVVHSRNNVAIRTDVFTFGTGTITEVRTLSTGESLTIVTNTTTLATTTTYSAT